MHTVYDENGNPVPHGHDHEHDHDHAQEDTGTSGGKQRALLQYMYDHNESHTKELDDLEGKFRGDGQEKVAEQIKKAVDEYEKGNMYLKLALSMVKE